MQRKMLWLNNETSQNYYNLFRSINYLTLITSVETMLVNHTYRKRKGNQPYGNHNFTMQPMLGFGEEPPTGTTIYLCLPQPVLLCEGRNRVCPKKK